MKFTKTRQGRKQRLRMALAPMHALRKRLHSPLSKELRKKLSSRTRAVRKGDEVVVTTGEHRKAKAKVIDVDVGSGTLHLEGVFTKTAKGREVPVPIRPNNVVIITLFERTGKAKKQPKKAPAQGGAQTPTKA
jgi:ribosomal protein uL24